MKRPRNYTIIPDCFAQGYISGEGHAFFQPPAEGRDAGDLGKAVQEGTLGSSDCRQSLIAWKIPRGDGEKLEDAIDITGRFAGAHRDYEPDDELCTFRGCGCSWDRWSLLTSLDQNRGDDSLPAPGAAGEHCVLPGCAVHERHLYHPWVRVIGVPRTRVCCLSAMVRSCTWTRAKSRGRETR